jgi:hypothetical protein
MAVDVMAIDDAADEVERAAEEKRDLHTLLKDLDVPIGSLVDLANVVDGSEAPERWAGDEQVQAVLLQSVPVPPLHLQCLLIGLR